VIKVLVPSAQYAGVTQITTEAIMQNRGPAATRITVARIIAADAQSARGMGMAGSSARGLRLALSRSTSPVPRQGRAQASVPVT